MARLILLDSGPLGLLTAPPGKAASQPCAQWLAQVIGAHCRIVVPEITDYELRRELLRAGKLASVNVGHLSRYASAELWQNIAP